LLQVRLLLRLRGLLLRGLLLLSLPPPTDPPHYTATGGAHGGAFSGIAADRAHGRPERGASGRSPYRTTRTASRRGPLARRWHTRRRTRIKAGHLHRGAMTLHLVLLLLFRGLTPFRKDIHPGDASRLRRCYRYTHHHETQHDRPDQHVALLL